MLFFYLFRRSESEDEYVLPVIPQLNVPAEAAKPPKTKKMNAGTGRSKKPSLPTVHAAKQSKPNKMNAGTGRSKKPSLPAVHEEVQSTPGPSKKVYEKVKPRVAELAQELGYEDQYLPAEISQIQNQSVPVTPTENGQEFRFFNTSTPIQAEAAKPKSNKSKAQVEETETPTKPKGRGGRPKQRKNNSTLLKEKKEKAAKGEFKMKGRC